MSLTVPGIKGMVTDFMDPMPSATVAFQAYPPLRDAIAKLETAKSFGNDTISSYFLKLALPFMETSFAIIFNTSIETSQFPKFLEISKGYSYF